MGFLGVYFIIHPHAQYGCCPLEWDGVPGGVLVFHHTCPDLLSLGMGWGSGGFVLVFHHTCPVLLLSLGWKGDGVPGGVLADISSFISSVVVPGEWDGVPGGVLIFHYTCPVLLLSLGDGMGFLGVY